MSRFAKGGMFKRLSGLPQERPKTKAGQIRWLWPEICAALESGHTLREIWEALAGDGLHLAYGKFRFYVARLRREMRTVVGSQVTPPPPERIVAYARAEFMAPRPDDPLANVKDRKANRPSFDYPPGLDEEKLF